MVLVLDNYDSFTWNLVQLLGELGAEVEVRRNDEVTVAQVRDMDPDRIVISPGPCTPAEAGVSVDLVRELGPDRPLLGVCLGHQAVGAAYGAKIVRARRMMHGKTSSVVHTGAGVFDGLESPLRVMRYHSLVIDRATLPEELEVVAWTGEDGWEDEVQGIRHERHPVWGVQFHPESIGTDAGRRIMENFLRLG